MQLKQKVMLGEHPRLQGKLGKYSFNMDQSLKDTPTKSDNDLDMTRSNFAIAFLMLLRGQVRTAKEIFAICASFKYSKR